MSTTRSDRCPCGGESYATCCEPYIAGWERAPTAEALMRSRYTAYARGEVDYLVETHAPETRDPDLRKHVAAWAASARFTKLEVLAHDEHTVTFVATYLEGGVTRVMSERSRFRKDPELGWLYERAEPGSPSSSGARRGEARAAAKSSTGASRAERVENRTAAPVRAAASSRVGRNDPCPCGSGRKHKVCCGR